MAEIKIIPESIQLIKITDEDYFSKNYKEYISNSKLSLINPDEGGSLEKYKKGYSGTYSESFELGSAVHGIVLQPEDYSIAPIWKPTAKLGLFAEKAYNLLKDIDDLENIPMNIIEEASKQSDYYSGKLTQNRINSALELCIPYWKKRREYELTISQELKSKQVYLSEPMFEKYTKCLLGIENNPKIKELLYPQGLISSAEYYNEYALLAEVEITLDNNEVKTLKLKAKLDNFTVNHETGEMTLNDLKTTGKPIGFFMGNWVKQPDGQNIWYDGSFQKFHYYRQMGMYLWLMSCYLKQNGINYKPKANMVVVETIPEYRTRIFSVNNKHIQRGLKEFKELLILAANE